MRQIDEQNRSSYLIRLQEYLFHFLNQQDPGLLVVRDHLVDDVVRLISSSPSFVSVRTRSELSSVLKSRLCAVLALSPGTSPALVGDVKQCAVRSGALQTVEEVSGSIVTIEYDPTESHILLIVTASQLSAVCHRFLIQEYVGLVEHL